MNLPKASFLALAAVGWGDGSLQRVEATGLLRAAREAGLAAEDYAAVERAISRRTDLDGLELSGLSERDRVLTYALASWLAQVDGVVSADEATTMVKLGEKLKLSDALRKRAAAAANDVACLPDGGRPERYDLHKLVERLQQRLPQVQ